MLYSSTDSATLKETALINGMSWVTLSPAGMGSSVEDPDSAFDEAVAAGATVVAHVHDEHGWRTGRITDPFGHDWEVSRQLTS